MVPSELLTAHDDGLGRPGDRVAGPTQAVPNGDPDAPPVQKSWLSPTPMLPRACPLLTRAIR